MHLTRFAFLNSRIPLFKLFTLDPPLLPVFDSWSLFKFLVRLSGFAEMVRCGRSSILTEIENTVLRWRFFDEERYSKVLAHA
jgi:hypothetical protein